MLENYTNVLAKLMCNAQFMLQCNNLWQSQFMRKAQFIPRSKRGFDGGKIMDFKNKIILAPMAHSLPLEVIPLRGEMSQSDKRVAALQGKVST